MNRVWLPVLLGAGGILCLAAGGVQLLLQLSFGHRASRTSGVVVYCVPDRGRTWLPVVQYTVGLGTRAFTPDKPSPSWPQRTGERLPLLYDPARPDRVELDDWTSRYASGVAWIFTGGVSLVAGMLRRRRDRLG